MLSPDRPLRHLFWILLGTAMILMGCQGAPKSPAIETTSFTAPAPLTIEKSIRIEPIHLRFTIWSTNKTQIAMLNEIGDAYTAVHPNVTIQFDSIPSDDYAPKVSIQLASGNPPDGGWVMETASASWIQSGILADLAPVVRSYPDYDFGDYVTPSLALWTKNDALYGIPFSTSPEFITYNIDLFKQAGAPTPDEMIAANNWTWESLAKTAKAIATNGPAGSYGFLSYDGGMFTASPLSTMVPVIWAYGGNVWSDDGSQCLLNTPKSVAAVQLLYDMTFIDKSNVPPGDKTTFASGKVGMTLHQLSRLAALSNVPFKWGIAPLPSGPAGQKPVIGQAAVVVFAKSPQKSAAMDFVTFMTTKENVIKMAKFYPPARVSILNSDALLKDNPNIDPQQLKAAVVEGILKGTVLPTHPDFFRIDQVIRIEFDKLWVPNADVQEVLNAASQAADPYFK